MTASLHPILLVEDNPEDILLIRRAFRKANLTMPLHVVEDGEAAVTYLNGQGDYADRRRYPLPQLVLLDLKLPRRSGLEVLGWLRQEPELNRLPVVVLTSSREPAEVQRARALGVHSYLVKSASFEPLVNLMRTFFQDQSPSASQD